ncbi:hypothetical protein J7I93_16270 [Bacillus sp. ISL-47]|uniref:hypothetical protein n=1 Tax=Bacillus sp. ISL-47 TaxID=2819130 RepID=UPI001BE6F17C|nr:hypothetical protein [Bacillus sp. ISL-47]MBT2689744.1 hypothetical protein [Bacillus sp. ISL-47]MBT2710157.1 hypothetical protein [Pseudomonas sp. ISL-84]
MLTNRSGCKENNGFTQSAKIYTTNDFLAQFIDQNTAIPAVINLNSAKGKSNFDFDPSSNTITVKKDAQYFLQFSVQVFSAAPPSNQPLRFELQINGGTIINSQTTFNNNTFDTAYVTSTLLVKELEKGDKIRLVLAAPSPIPSGAVIRMDFASITIFEA